MCMPGIHLAPFPLRMLPSSLRKEFHLRLSPRAMLLTVVFFVIGPCAFLAYTFFSIPFSPPRPESETAAYQLNAAGTSQDAIQTIVEAVAPGASVLLSDEGSNVGAAARSPFEVIVNAQATDCSDAKATLFQLMRSLYADATVRPHVRRVLVSSPGYLSASLGSRDGYGIAEEAWQSTGPSNFFATLRRAGSADIDGVPLGERTWARGISGCL
jgi:hypothetical protein